MYRNFGIFEASIISKQFRRLMKAVVVSNTDYKCETCQRYFKNRASDLVHKKRNNCSRPFEQRLEDSDSDFYWDADEVVIKNTDTKTEEPQNTDITIIPWKRKRSALPYKCSVCCGRFTTEEGLTKHVQLHHPSPLTCDLCGFTTANRHYMVSHMNHRHLPRKNKKDEVKNYVCQICAKTFMTKAVLRNHELIHLPEKMYKCSQCDKAFAQLGGLRAHFTLKHISKIYKCKDCDREFDTQYKWKYHVQTVHMNLPAKIYTCPECKMEYKIKKYFKTHVCEHKKNKPVSTANKKYLCGQCDYRTQAQSFLDAHIASKHTGIYQFQCRYCGQKLAYNHSYRNHEKKCEKKEKLKAETNNSSTGVSFMV